MIIINPPVIKEENDFAIISSTFVIDDKTDVLWYKIPLKYKFHLVSERLDAFVVGLLFLALKTGNDIEVKAPISERLYYTLNHYIIETLCFFNPEYKKIKIVVDELDKKDLNIGNVSATGLSCGVDSLSTFYDNIDEKGTFAIKYFTFFNVGSHGDEGGEKARKIFYSRQKSTREFAKKVGNEFISIDSNLSEILKMRFQKTYNLRNISCVLILQKLFKNYYYASGTRFDHFALNKDEIADLDMLLIPNLSTESTNFHVSVLQYNRIERTKLISQFEDTFNFLDVCTNPRKDLKKINCSECYKCFRTMLTLELLGKLENYRQVFDLKKFKKHRNKYLGYLISKKTKLTLDKELIIFLKKRDMLYNKEVYYFALKYYLYKKNQKLIHLYRNN